MLFGNNLRISKIPLQIRIILLAVFSKLKRSSKSEKFYIAEVNGMAHFQNTFNTFVVYLKTY